MCKHERFILGQHNGFVLRERRAVRLLPLRLKDVLSPEMLTHVRVEGEGAGWQLPSFPREWGGWGWFTILEGLKNFMAYSFNSWPQLVHWAESSELLTDATRKIYVFLLLTLPSCPWGNNRQEGLPRLLSKIFWRCNTSWMLGAC